MAVGDGRPRQYLGFLRHKLRHESAAGATDSLAA